ncbi:MAG: hypothetical protein M0019_07125 [Actinomycetota bacterium]|nr:hypothetical protein [Actinomycetota bacterium]
MPFLDTHESDLIIGPRGASAVSTHLEPTNRLVPFVGLPRSRSAKEIEAAIDKETRTLLNSLVKTIH